MAAPKVVYGLDRIKAEVGGTVGSDYKLTADVTIPALTGRALSVLRADKETSFEEMLHAVMGVDATEIVLAQSPAVCMALLEDIFKTIGAADLLGDTDPFSAA